MPSDLEGAALSSSRLARLALVSLLSASSGCAGSSRPASTSGDADAETSGDADAATGTDVLADVSTAHPLVSCRPEESRCGSCGWQEQGVPHCLVTVFVGLCPPDATYGDCAPNPRAVCDRACHGRYPDRTLSYDGDDLVAAEAACLASTSAFTGCAVAWTVLP